MYVQDIWFTLFFFVFTTIASPRPGYTANTPSALVLLARASATAAAAVALRLPLRAAAAPTTRIRDISLAAGEYVIE